jgi:hypothetical protein
LNIPNQESSRFRSTLSIDPTFSLGKAQILVSSKVGSDISSIGTNSAPTSIKDPRLGFNLFLESYLGGHISHYKSEVDGFFALSGEIGNGRSNYRIPDPGGTGNELRGVIEAVATSENTEIEEGGFAEAMETALFNPVKGWG